LLLCCFLYWLCWARPLAAEPWSGLTTDSISSREDAIARWLTTLNGSWLGAYEPRLLAKPPCFGFWLALVQLFRTSASNRRVLLRTCASVSASSRRQPIVFLAGWRFAVVTFLLVVAPGPHASSGCSGHSPVTLGCRGADRRRGARSPSARIRPTQARWAVLLGLLFAGGLSQPRRISLARPGCRGGNHGRLRRWLENGQTLVDRCSSRRMHFGCKPSNCGGVHAQRAGLRHFRNLHTKGAGIDAPVPYLTRLEPDRHERFLPVAAETRAHAYRCSPEFARLQPISKARWRRVCPQCRPYCDQAAARPERGSSSPVTRMELVDRCRCRRRVGCRANGSAFREGGVELDAAIRDGRLKAEPEVSASWLRRCPVDARRLAEAAGRSMTAGLTVQGMIPNPCAAFQSDIPRRNSSACPARTHAALAPPPHRPPLKWSLHRTVLSRPPRPLTWTVSAL